MHDCQYWYCASKVLSYVLAGWHTCTGGMGLDFVCYALLSLQLTFYDS